MQKAEEESLRREQSPQRKVSTPNWYRLLTRYRKHPEVLEPFLLSLKNTGISEEKLSNLKEVLVAWQEDIVGGRSSHNQNGDRYIIGGTGAIDIILLPVLLSMGIADKSLSFALLALVVSLPLLGCSLYLSFVKQEFGITSYGIVLPTLMSLSTLISFAAMTAFIWHVSVLDGIVFLSLTVFLAFFTLIYGAFILFRKEYMSTIAKLRKIVTSTSDNLEQKDKITQA